MAGAVCGELESPALVFGMGICKFRAAKIANTNGAWLKHWWRKRNRNRRDAYLLIIQRHQSSLRLRIYG